MAGVWLASDARHLYPPLPRVHCFHYLIPLAKQGNYAIVANVESMDYDPLVVKLNKDISAIEEVMGANLQQHKFQYIFEGADPATCELHMLPYPSLGQVTHDTS